MILANLADSVVFLTGGSGMLGAALVEKLLRSTKVKKIFLLLRDKQTRKDGLRPSRERLTDITSSSLFDTLRASVPDFREMIARVLVPVTGDVSFDQVIIDDAERASVLAETNYVIHCASSVRFDQTLADSFLVQTMGSVRVRNLAAQMPQLRAHLHCSTAFVGKHQAPGVTLQEALTDLPYDAFGEYQTLLGMSEEQREKRLQELKNTVAFPNAYVFSKSMTEHVLAGLQKNAPIPSCIVRPAIVGAALREPIPGYIGSVQGVSAVYMALGCGLRRFNGDPDAYLDLVPQDVCINAMLAALVATAATAASSTIGFPIYNVASSWSNPVKVLSTGDSFLKYWVNHKPKRRFGEPSSGVTADRDLYRRWIYWHVEVPSILLGCFAKAICCAGPRNRSRHRAQQGKRTAAGLYKLGDAIGPFSCSQKIVSTVRTETLWKQLSVEHAEDAQQFPFDIDSVDWDAYCQNWAHGLRRFVLKETDDATVPCPVPPVRLSVPHPDRYGRAE